MNIQVWYWDMVKDGVRLGDLYSDDSPRNREAVTFLFERSLYRKVVEFPNFPDPERGQNALCDEVFKVFNRISKNEFLDMLHVRSMSVGDIIRLHKPGEWSHADWKMAASVGWTNLDGVVMEVLKQRSEQKLSESERYHVHINREAREGLQETGDRQFYTKEEQEAMNRFERES